MGSIWGLTGLPHEAGVDPSTVVLEITEHAMVEGALHMGAALRDVEVLGVRLAIDDFGTGYSSLRALDELDVDLLKIAKPFVDGLATERSRPALAEAIVQLGRSLQLQLVAEGVEDPGRLAALREMGCDWAQGFLLGPPMEAAAFERLLADQTMRSNPSCTTDTTWVPSRV